MKDFHTHILPNMDDGSQDIITSLEMLKSLKLQGADGVVLTPHYYYDVEDVGAFLIRREISVNELLKHIGARDNYPNIYLGAEVAFFPNMSKYKDIDRLCIEGTKYMLLEMPFGKWSHDTLEEVDNLYNNKNIVPIIAHLERYIAFQKGTNNINDLLKLNLIIQINSGAFKRKIVKPKYHKFLTTSDIYVIGSDSHNMDERKPDLKKAIEYINNSIGKNRLMNINQLGDEILINATRL